MPDLLSQVYVYMSCTFLLGLLLGWLVWSFGSSRERNLIVSESEFWKSQMNEARRKQDEGLNTINELLAEKANLKKRLSSMAS